MPDALIIDIVQMHEKKAVIDNKNLNNHAGKINHKYCLQQKHYILTCFQSISTIS